MSRTYILRTSRNSNAWSFDSLTAAREAKEFHEKRVGVRLRIIEQTIVEKEIAA